MSKREELESKRDQLDKEVSKDNCLNTITLYERSVLCQGIISPTVYNALRRKDKSIYA